MEALESSPSYRGALAELTASGLLAGERSVEAFEVAGGILRPEPLISSLGATKAQPPPRETAT